MKPEEPMFPSSIAKIRMCLLCTAVMLFTHDIQAQTPVLNITGANETLERNLRAHIAMPNLSCDSQADRLSRFSPPIRRSILGASRALGFYLLESTTEFIAGEPCWSLNITITPGEAVRVSDIDINIRGDEQLFNTVLNDLPLIVGEQLNQASYEQIKTNLSSRAVEVGFFSARFEKSQLLVNLQENSAAVEIDFDPGERYKFGTVEIEPVEYLSNEFIRRYLGFDEDAFYSSNALIELRNSLNDSQYFSNVTVTPALDQTQTSNVPIQVALNLRPRRVYSAGTGVTTDIGPRLSFDYENRYLNRNGHKFDVGSSASPVEQTVDLNYTIPWTKPATENLRFSGGFLNEDNDTFENQTFKFSSIYSFINRFEWRQNYSLSFQHDEYDINNEDEKSDLLITGLSLARTRADDALYPTRGWRLFGQVRGASSSLLSNESFLQFNLNGKHITSVGPGRLITKFEIGTILADQVAELPASVQYFTGGDQTVRGYKYQSLGPENELGEVVGGKHQLVAGLEYDFSIKPNWKLALFTDAGNAFSKFDDFELKQSVGIGIRWLSPIGPIRADIASALDDDNKLRLHISMGPDL